MCCLCGWLFVCCPTFCSYKKLAIFTTNVDAEKQTLINHKCVCVALNRHFCQTDVSCSGFCHPLSFVEISKHISLIPLLISINIVKLSKSQKRPSQTPLLISLISVSQLNSPLKFLS